MRPLRLISIASLCRLAAVPGLGLALLALGSGGCDTRGFYDPTEMAPYTTQPLAMPILTSVDPAVEEQDTDFANATDPTPADQKLRVGDYTVSAGDLLQITISDLNGPGGADTQKVTRVSDSGNISLNFIGSLHAAGLTEIELEQAIVEAYRNANIVQNAQVQVADVDPRGRTFSIVGAVAAPGEYTIIDPQFRLLNAIVSARGTTFTGIDYLYITRQDEPAKGDMAPAPAAAPVAPPTVPAKPDELAPPKTEAPSVSNTAVASAADSQNVRALHLLADAPTTEPASVTRPAAAPADNGKPFEFAAPEAGSGLRIIRIPLNALLKGDMRYNIPIRPRDVINIPQPEAGEYYMAGHVQRPGAFTLTNRKITLKEAVAAAGMLDAVAIPQRTELIRRIAPNHEIFVRVDLSQIYSGNQPDIYLKPYDQVMVGTNALASFLAAARGAFRVTYGFGFLYDRNYYTGLNG